MRRGSGAALAGRRILITGIAGSVARALAAVLEDDPQVEHLAGVDLVDPPPDLKRTEFFRADLRGPLIARVLRSTRADTIVHLARFSAPRRAGGRGRMKELNVIGTMQLMGAAQKDPDVQRVIVRSSTAVYGSHPDDPALIREESELGSHGAAHGYSKDAIEVERYARSFGRRRPDVSLTILRFANFIGPTVSTPLTAYLSLPVVPTVLGFDPRLQLCHEQDAVEVLRRAVLGEHPGTFNVAGPGVMYLSQAIRRAGRPVLPVIEPLVQGTASLLRQSGRVDFSPEQLAFLRYGRVGDITRLRQDFGYEPRFSTIEAFDDFLASGRVRPLVDADTVARLEEGARTALVKLARVVAQAGGRS